jgi:hypothetical protein
MLGYNRGDRTNSILRLCNASRVLIASLIPNSTIHLPLTTGEEPHVEVVPLMLRTGTRRGWSRGSSHLNLVMHTQSWRCCYGRWWWCYRWQPEMLPSHSPVLPMMGDVATNLRRCCKGYADDATNCMLLPTWVCCCRLRLVLLKTYDIHATDAIRCCYKGMTVMLPTTGGSSAKHMRVMLPTVMCRRCYSAGATAEVRCCGGIDQGWGWWLCSWWDKKGCHEEDDMVGHTDFTCLWFCIEKNMCKTLEALDRKPGSCRGRSTLSSTPSISVWK